MSHLRLINPGDPPAAPKKGPSKCGCGRVRNKHAPRCKKCDAALVEAAKRSEPADLVALREDHARELAALQVECDEIAKARDEFEERCDKARIESDAWDEQIERLEGDRELLLSLVGISEHAFEINRARLEGRGPYIELLP